MDATREELTPRELEILRLIAAGLSDKLIAQQLGIARSTVSSHIATILLKLRVRNRTAAAAVAVASGLAQFPSRSE
jgi:DNA-binding NarL/FixJ family response regulator